MSKKKKNEQRETVAHDLKSQIVGLKAGVTLPVAPAKAVPADKDPAALPVKVNRSMVSVEVKDQSRCGRAPYNFVPEPEPPRKWREAPTHEVYDAERVSGFMDFSIEALSDFFVRGWRTLQSHRVLPPDEDGRVEAVLDSFMIDGMPGIPGSSLRGLVRTIFEILSMAELDPVNNRRMFYRAVGTSDQKGDASFEPQAETYKDRLFEQPIRNPSRPSAQVGLLEMDGPDWVISPMTNQTVFRYGGEYYKDQLGYWPVCFRPPAVEWGTVPSSDVTNAPAGAVSTRGFLICSGLMQGKYTQWIMHNDPDRSQALKVSRDLRNDFLEDGVTQWMNGGKGRNFRYGRTIEDEGRPIFYITDNSGEVIAFGHTPFFRTPYDHTIHSLRRRAAGEEPWGDMAKSVFGTLDTGGKSGRVFFEDATCTSATWETPGKKTVVLGSPKPTTYQHYLHQENYEHGKIEFWDSNPKARLRGHKLYWHRPPAEYPPPPNNNPDIGTSLKPVLYSGEGSSNSPKFKSRIRFDNLSSEELGCLLLVFDLPKDRVKRAHKIGMGKPLGLGSFKITVDRVMRIDRVSRYEKLLNDDGTLIRSEKEIEPADLAKFEASFAEWYLGKSMPSEADAEEFVREKFWTDPRLKELLAILSWPPPGEVTNEAWKNRTRYMGIEQALYRGRYDEYRKVWNDRTGNAVPAPRKPLPPATQVWTNRPAVPDDAYIPYQRPRQSGGGRDGPRVGGWGRRGH
jgi:CRISPR-associated protein (TIGR03986 family)